VLDQGEFTTLPGEDINYCVRIPIPEKWRTRDLALGGWSWDLSYTHHHFMEYSPHPFPAAGSEPVPCNEYTWNPATSSYQHVPGATAGGKFSLVGSANNENSKIVFGGGEGKGYVMLDGRHGRYLAKNGHFRTSHHLINTTLEPITTRARFKVCVQDAAATPFLVNSLVCTTTAIDVPANASGFARATCTVPHDADIVLLASHAHEHLTRFTVQRYDGTQTLPEVLYESVDWDSPRIVNLDEPLHLKKGEGLTYTCEYRGPAVFADDTTRPEAEHCAVFTGYSFPDPRPGAVPPQLTGLATLPEQVSEAFPSLDVSPI
jgi:hypothetical protein